MPGMNLKMRNNKHLLPAIALVTAALLLTGEWFSCCRINEAFAKEIAQIAQTLGLVENSSRPLDLAVTVDADAHPQCHGHAVTSAADDALASTTPDSDLHPASAAYAQDSRCLSENAITRQSMVGSESLNLAYSAPAGAEYELPIAIPFASVERPRPQNRSSPPVYLLTLRILV